MRYQSEFALLATLSALAGCGGMDTYVCQPACPGGSHCVASGCVPNSAGADLSAGRNDLPADCTPACISTLYCNASHQCVPCLADAHCPLGAICKASGATSACVPGCADDSRCGAAMKCCAGQCVDPSKDALNCGACGTACGAPHATAACAAGACKLDKCDPEWGDCNNDPKDGCEANLHIDQNNCTACGMKCAYPHATAGCSDGCYLENCDFGWADCNNDVDNKDGCEKDVSADPANCGACGKSCNNKPNAFVGCVNSFCQLKTCTANWLDCDGDANNGCEVNGATDGNNCGACKNACAQGLVCRGGGCTCPNCMIPNAATRCVNNQCVLDRCNPGYADCNNNAQDGCEISIWSDPKNCNACGMVCPMGQNACVQGMCQVMPVNPIFSSMPKATGSTQRGAGDACGTLISVNQNNTVIERAARRQWQPSLHDLGSPRPQPALCQPAQAVHGRPGGLEAV